MKKNKIVWRLGKLPSTEELRELVKDKIITQEEAREILFNTEEVEERDIESYKAEIKFLREMVDKLSDRSKIVQTIETIKPYYITQSWYPAYGTWTTYCNAGAGTCGAGASSLNYCSSATNASNYLDCSVTSASFTDISTF